MSTTTQVKPAIKNVTIKVGTEMRPLKVVQGEVAADLVTRSNLTGYQISDGSVSFKPTDLVFDKVSEGQQLTAVK